MPCGPLRWPAWHRGRRVEGKRVKRMTFNADADLLARAQQVLGTATATDTINTALAERGPKHQRQVGHADLLIAVAAESAGVPVLHDDADFDLITEVSGIDTRWVRPQGSL